MKIVVDIGGTNTRVASSVDGQTIAERTSFPTPEDFQEGVSQIAAVVQGFLGDRGLSGMAIGVPGTVDRSASRTIVVANLHSWDDQDIRGIFASRLNCPVVVVNDAELAALGEASLGAGEGFASVGYLTVGTGIGGALVVDNHLIPRVYNSEPGHMTIDLGSELVDGTGRRGTLEALASGLAFERRFGQKPAENDDAAVWERFARDLSMGVVNVILLWSPQVLVIGGGLTQKGDLLFNPLRRFVEESLVVFPAPAILPAKLGTDAPFFGGLTLLKNNGR